MHYWIIGLLRHRTILGNKRVLRVLTFYVIWPVQKRVVLGSFWGHILGVKMVVCEGPPTNRHFGVSILEAKILEVSFSEVIFWRSDSGCQVS